jgi:small-conductance mechanosensitive channel
LADDAARLSEDKRRLEEANQDLRGTIGELRAKLDDRQQRQRQRNELNEIMKFGNQQISELKRRQHGKLAYVESVDANLVREWRQIAEAWLGRERPDFLGTFNSTNDMSLGVMPGNAIRAGIIQHFEHRIGRLNQLYAELAPS